MFCGRISLNSVLLLLSEFCEWVQVGIDVYIINNRSVLAHLNGFQLLVLLLIAHRNYFFCLYQQNKSSESKVKFRQASNLDKIVLAAGKLAYANKTKESNLVFGTFGELIMVFSTKVNLLYPLYSMAQRCCLLHLIKEIFLLKTFLATLVLMTHVSLYLFPFRNDHKLQL